MTRLHGTTAFLSVLACTSMASALDFVEVDINQWVGEGENEALMVVDWTDGRQLAFGYRWSVLETATGLDMLLAVSSAVPEFWHTWVDGLEEQAVFGLGWDVDGDGGSPSDTDDWYEEGWLENGYWGYYESTDGDDWGFALSGLDERVLSDGDWDGWAWAPDFIGSAPVVPLVPAPSVMTVMLLGMRGRRRRD